MEADKLIQAFTQVIRHQDFVFSPEAIATIPALRETIAEFETQSPQELAEAIRNWYINHEDVNRGMYPLRIFCETNIHINK
ncbi:hypothetical protein [Nostoc sp.]|uniref:hypothetical protein n=1 Tax=Nostoc sp. TaxID=1180 RepID=UPI002FFC335F